MAENKELKNKPAKEKINKDMIEEWNKVCDMFKGVQWVKPGEGGRRLQIKAKVI